MDPIFGLPCINESRAMDNARNRNYIAEKMLAQKFESIDIAKKSVSGKFLTSRCDVEDFRESLDTGKLSPHPRRGPVEKKSSSGSMSLREFDRIIHEAKDRKDIQSSPRVQRLSTSAKASNPNSLILKKENTIVLNTFDSDSNHIIDLESREKCLPINRQKHAMRDAWERATSEDVHHKRLRAPKYPSPQSSSSYKGHDKVSCESPVQTRHTSSVKHNADRKKV